MRLTSNILTLLVALLWGTLLYAGISPMETEYMALSQRYETRDKRLAADLKAYLKKYPYTTYEDEIRFMSAVLQTEKGHWKQAIKLFEQIDHRALSRPHQTEYQYYRGYSYLHLAYYDRAMIYFERLSNGENPYTLSARYYYAYCLYQLRRYADALPNLLALEQEGEYGSTVPYYIVQIYYAKQLYEEVEDRAQSLLLAQPDNDNNIELHRILGEIFYQKSLTDTDTSTQKIYLQKAATHLSTYAQVVRDTEVPIVRNDLYLLGMAHYHLGNYSEAIEAFKQVKQEKDIVSEAVYLALGNAYRRLGQIEQAKLSYQGAVSLALTASVQEEAMYNYTLCTYQSSTALGESVQAFTTFIHTYPKSNHIPEIYELLGDAFLRSRNYSAALDALDSIPAPTAKMRRTKQYLRYQIGMDAFLQGKMHKAHQYMSAVISHTHEADHYTCEAYYWRAEINYRLRAYREAIADIESFYQSEGATSSTNYTASAYLAGYAYFTNRQYDQAERYFSDYIQHLSPLDPTYADALNRLGDCAFNARAFSKSISYYNRVIEKQATGVDYAYFQKGYALGLQHNYADKIKVMQTLVKRYPKSDYADDGLYEIARANLQINQDKNAIVAYQSLLKKYPNSQFARKASLECAMIYRNLKQHSEAMKAYRRTIETYPATEEAYMALQGLEALYVESGNIDEYLAYTKQLGELNMRIVTKDDSLSYAAAELQYMQGNYTRAIAMLGLYLSTYCPGGRHCTTVQYYIADSYFRSGKTEEALREYLVLADKTGNPYMKEVCMRIAGILYDKGEYQPSLDYFRRMLSLASDVESTHIAQLGILRCATQLKDNATTLQMANEILGSESLTEDMRKEALYSRAKTYIVQQAWSEAIHDLEQLSTEVHTSVGAEAKYLLAECYYRLLDLERAEKEIMAFTEMNTQQQYWLARALILLSDINYHRGDSFQAEQYLITLQNNYHGEDDIQGIVSEKLAKIAEKEKEQVAEAPTKHEE